MVTRILFFQEESGIYVLHFALNHTFFFTKITDQDLLSVYIVIPMLKYGLATWTLPKLRGVKSRDLGGVQVCFDQKQSRILTSE